jgi:hypothetical protein
MNASVRHSVWFGRGVLGLASLLFTAIAVRALVDPVGASAAHEIVLGSPAGVTVIRVGFGAFPLAFAIVFAACIVSERRLFLGLAVLCIAAVVVTGARLLGLALDGPAEFTLRVLKPEVALVVASAAALLLERRRLRVRG